MLMDLLCSVTDSIVAMTDAEGREGAGEFEAELGSGLWPSVTVSRLPRHRLALGGAGLILGFLSVLVGLVVESEKEGDGVFLDFRSSWSAATSWTLDEDEVAGCSCTPSDWTRFGLWPC